MLMEVKCLGLTWISQIILVQTARLSRSPIFISFTIFIFFTPYVSLILHTLFYFWTVFLDLAYITQLKLFYSFDVWNIMFSCNTSKCKIHFVICYMMHINLYVIVHIQKYRKKNHSQKVGIEWHTYSTASPNKIPIGSPMS